MVKLRECWACGFNVNYDERPSSCPSCGAQDPCGDTNDPPIREAVRKVKEWCAAQKAALGAVGCQYPGCERTDSHTHSVQPAIQPLSSDLTEKQLDTKSPPPQKTASRTDRLETALFECAVNLTTALIEAGHDERSAYSRVQKYFDLIEDSAPEIAQ